MILVIATAGLVYELGMAAVASYVLGDSVRQFSIVIGVYLSALGLGAYLSRFVVNNLAIAFINVELSTALLGGLSAPGLFIAFSLGASFELLLLVVVTAVGTLVGIELPLLMRILEHRLPFKDLVSRSLSYDYAGALLGSLGFSLYFVPQLGLVQTSVICGLLNAVVGLISTFLLREPTCDRTNSIRNVRFLAIFVIVFLVTATFIAPRLVSYCETRSYGARTKTLESPYQHIALVNRGETVELYLNGHLQFSSRDECRYHEALVHPIMSEAPNPRHVFIGGGGDGLALREVLKWPQVESVTLVDLDPVITHIAKTDAVFLRLNHNSLSDQRVRIINEDAFQWVEKDHKVYDVVILDFPDPTTYGVGKLFSTVFYSRIRKMISPHGALIVQSTSPLVSNLSFWSIRQTLISVGFSTLPLRVYLPSFGDWGFVLAKFSPFKLGFQIPEAVHLECLKQTQLELLTYFPVDTRLRFSNINSLNSQSLVHQYLDEASRFD
jgi:spermidine synthase